VEVWGVRLGGGGGSGSCLGLTPSDLASCIGLCVSAGGAISLLALNGLFILIHKHNL
jgi:hypothetical protein